MFVTKFKHLLTSWLQQLVDGVQYICVELAEKSTAPFCVSLQVSGVTESQVYCCFAVMF